MLSSLRISSCLPPPSLPKAPWAVAFRIHGLQVTSTLQQERTDFVQEQQHHGHAFLLLLSWCWIATFAAGQPRIAILTISPGALAQPHIAQTVVNKAKCVKASNDSHNLASDSQKILHPG